MGFKLFLGAGTMLLPIGAGVALKNASIPIGVGIIGVAIACYVVAAIIWLRSRRGDQSLGFVGPVAVADGGGTAAAASQQSGGQFAGRDAIGTQNIHYHSSAEAVVVTPEPERDVVTDPFAALKNNPEVRQAFRRFSEQTRTLGQQAGWHSTPEGLARATRQQAYMIETLGDSGLDILVTHESDSYADYRPDGESVAKWHGAVIYTGEFTITNRTSEHVTLEPSLVIHADEPVAGADPLVVEALQHEPPALDHVPFSASPEVPYFGRRIEIPPRETRSGYLVFVVGVVLAMARKGGERDIATFLARVAEADHFIGLKDRVSGRGALFPLTGGYDLTRMR